MPAGIAFELNRSYMEKRMQQQSVLVRQLAAALLIGVACVTAQAADPVSAAPAAATADDAAITAQVQAALQKDKDLSALPIVVNTNAGVVVLTGAVPSAAAAELAVKLAQAVPGVKEVKSELKLPG